MESVQPKYVPISTLAKIWGRSKMYIYRRIDMIRNEGRFNEICMQLGPQQTLVHVDKFEAAHEVAKGGIKDEHYKSNYNRAMVLRDIRVRTIWRN